MQTVTIGALAKQAGVRAGTVRYYESLGLLCPVARSASGYRLYYPADRKRLHFIRRAQQLGFSLDDVAVLLQLSQEPSAKAADVRRLAEEKLADIGARIEDLTRIQQALQAVAGICHGDGPAKDCPILAALNEGSAAPSRKVPA